MNSLVFTYPSTREANNQVLDDLKRCLSECGVEGHLIYILSLTVSEAFTNAVVHAHREDRSKVVTLQLQVNEDQIIADIIDQGSGGLRQIESKRPSTTLDEGGRGIDLIRHFADDCYFAETKDGGLKVTIRFHRMRQNEHIT